MSIFYISYYTRKKWQIGFGLVIAVGSIIAGNYSSEINKAFGIDCASTVFTILMWAGFALAAYALVGYAVHKVKSKARGLVTQAVNSASASLEKQVTPKSAETKYKLREAEKPVNQTASATAKQTSTRVCGYCGSPMKSGEAVCGSCGAPAE